MQHNCNFDCKSCGKFDKDPEMVKKHDTLMDVIALVLPTGETLWMEGESQRPGYLKKVVDRWKELHPEFDGSRCSMGAVCIKMPTSQYTAIRATNLFDWPEYA